MPRLTNIEHLAKAKQELYEALACIMNPNGVTISHVRKALDNARGACCNLNEIELSMCGVIPPKDG